jgi:hypothetical protein
VISQRVASILTPPQVNALNSRRSRQQVSGLRETKDLMPVVFPYLGFTLSEITALEERLLSEEAVFCGEAGSLCARVDPQLAVDRAHMPVDGAGAEE